MNFLNKFAIQSLKLNKKRTVSTILGVILSTALICGFSILCLSFKETLVQSEIVNSGNYHLQIENVSKQEKDALAQNRDIKDIHYVNKIGYGRLKNCKNEAKPYIQLSSMDKNTFDHLAFHLTEGRFPENEHEIIISEHMLSNGGMEYKIGDEVQIPIGERTAVNKEEVLYDFNAYDEGKEKIIHEKPYKFTIVGIIERPAVVFERVENPGYSAITTNISNNMQDMFITFKNPKKYKTSISQIVGVDNFDDIGLEETKFDAVRIQINNELIRWQALSFSDSNTRIMYSVGLIIIGIIMLTSIYCIRNAFHISLLEKKKIYGMLASVGATKKQLYKSVLTEACIMACIGIPIGILSGITAIYIVVKVVNIIIGDMLFSHMNGIVYKISWISIIIAILLGFVTIYFSAKSSAKKASKMSPIQNLKNSDDININEKQVRSPKIIRKLFGMGGEIAYKNLKRSKNKYRTTVISLMISVFVFISISTFIQDAFVLSSKYYSSYDYNLVIDDYYSIQKISADVSLKNKIDRILNNDQIIYLYRTYYGGLEITDKSKINPAFLEKIKNETSKKFDENQYNYLTIMALDDVSYHKFCKKIGVNYDEVKDKAILNDYNFDDESKNKNQSYRTFTYKKGDQIKGIYGEDKQIIKKIIGAVTDQTLYGMEDSYTENGYMVVNQKYEKDVKLELENVLIHTNNLETVEKEMHKLSLNVTNLEKMAKESNAMRMVISIFLYGFLTVIILISLTNIFNTITSNVELRQREFAMLKSIGMKSSEFNHMVNLETIFYCTKSLVFGLLFGCIVSIMINRSFGINALRLPIHAILISIITVFVIVFIIMRYSIHKINKQNIIETIRNENI